MKNSKLKIGVTDVVLVLISVIFCLGILFVFGPCEPMEDGSFMTCHWAGNAVAGIAAVLVVISAAHLFVPERGIKLGLSMAMIPTAVLACLLPGHLISLCMMEDMRCHAVMVPAVTVCGILVIAAAGVDIFMQNKK